jgi:hypothetical protein
MIRVARFADVPRLVELLHEMRTNSIYVDRADIDQKAAKSLLVSSIQRHGGGHAGSTLVLVAETEAGDVEGFVIGLLDRVYGIGDKLTATDIITYASPRADAHDAMRLVNALVAWAKANPKCIEVRLGANDVMGGDWQRTARLYERAGMKQVGSIYEARFER